MTQGAKRAFTLPEAGWQAIAENVADAVFVTDRSLRILWVNRRAEELLERSLDEMCGHLVSEFFWDEQAEPPLQFQALYAGQATDTRRVFKTGRGGRRVLEVHARNLGAKLLVGIARDVTERLDAIARLERSEASFRAIIEHAPDGMVVHASGPILYANSAALRMLGYDRLDELRGRSILTIVPSDGHSFVQSRIRGLETSKESPFVEQRLLRRDGSVLTASIGAVKVVFEGQEAIAVMARDVTEQRALEGQLTRAEQMAALGMLAAGVAHEINNPLAYLMLRLDAIGSTSSRLRSDAVRLRERIEARFGEAAARELLEGCARDTVFDELDDHLATALEGAKRVRTIVNDLRVSSRVDDQVRAEILVTGPLARALGLAAHELQRRARVVTSYGEVPPVLANEGRLTQLFLNLLLNAAHAIEEGHPERNEVKIAVWAEGDDVCVSITDSGAGIPEEVLPRLFQPFFTTKPAGVGTGLGLSICHGIVTSLLGTIRVESTVGRGTTFTVVLPRLRAEP